MHRDYSITFKIKKCFVKSVLDFHDDDDDDESGNTEHVGNLQNNFPYVESQL